MKARGKKNRRKPPRRPHAAFQRMASGHARSAQRRKQGKRDSR